jgi:hypothetical protein
MCRRKTWHQLYRPAEALRRSVQGTSTQKHSTKIVVSFRIAWIERDCAAETFLGNIISTSTEGNVTKQVPRSRKIGLGYDNLAAEMLSMRQLTCTKKKNGLLESLRRLHGDIMKEHAECRQGYTAVVGFCILWFKV